LLYSSNTIAFLLAVRKLSMPGQIIFKRGSYGLQIIPKTKAVKVHKKIPSPPPTGRRDKE
jgi:hypothetical protein